MCVSENKEKGWLERYASERPVLFSIVVFLTAGLITEIKLESGLFNRVPSPADSFLSVAITHAAAGLLLVAILIRLGLFNQAGFGKGVRWKEVWLLWPLLFFVLMNLEGVLDGSLVLEPSSPWVVGLYILLNISVAFCEEVMARGVGLLVLMRKYGRTRKGTLKAVLVCSILFGFAHIFNALSGRLPLLSTLTQIVISTSIGFCFAACYLRIKSIWATTLMHALINLGGSLRHLAVGGADLNSASNNTLSGFLVFSLISLPLILYSVMILRKASPLTTVSPGDSMEENS